MRKADAISEEKISCRQLICFCTLHDKLFENGYFSMKNNLSIIWKDYQKIKAIEIWKNDCTEKFKLPLYKKPSPVFIQQHRIRTGFPSMD